MLASSKLIGGGLATIGLMGVGIGIGIVFGSMVIALSRNPTLEGMLFKYALMGFASTEAMALFVLMIAFLMWYLGNIFGGLVYRFFKSFLGVEIAFMMFIVVFLLCLTDLCLPDIYCIFLYKYTDWRLDKIELVRHKDKSTTFKFIMSYKDSDWDIDGRHTVELSMDDIIGLGKVGLSFMSIRDRTRLISALLRFLKNHKKTNEYKVDYTKCEKFIINNYISMLRHERDYENSRGISTTPK